MSEIHFEKQELLNKVIQLESYVQTLEKANQSKNSELLLLRKKVQLLKDQNMVLKVQSKNTHPDRYLSMESMILELEEKLEVAMQQCVVYKTQNEKLKRRLELHNKNYDDEQRTSIKKYSSHLSPSKLSYPTSILKNSDKQYETNVLRPSMKFNSVQRRVSTNSQRQKYNSHKNRQPINDSLEYSNQQCINDFQNMVNEQNFGKVFTTNAFHNTHKSVRKSRQVVSNSSSRRNKRESEKNFMLTDGECQALGKIMDQLRDGQRRIRRY